MTPEQLREHAKQWDDDGRYSIGEVFRSHAAALEELERVKDELLGVKEYREKNPLGGPAKVFDAMADQIRAGDDFNKVIADYGWCPVSRAERAEVALAECRAKLEVDPRTKYDGIDSRDETIRLLENELEESARLHGMGASREAALQARLAESERKCKRLKFHAEAMAEAAELCHGITGLNAAAAYRAEFKE